MELVTDRTEADVLNRTPKGLYGPGDLNRVEVAVGELVELAGKMDIHLNLTIKTNWGEPGVFPSGFPTESEMARYLGNVRAVCTAFGVAATLPSTMRRLTHTGANRIECVLGEAFLISEQTIPNAVFCGEQFAGEE